MCQHYLTRKQLTQGDMELKICFQWSLLCSTNTVSSCCEKTDGRALCDACLITWEVPFCCSLCFLGIALPVMANNSTYRLCWFQTSTARSAPVYLWCGFLIREFSPMFDHLSPPGRDENVLCYEKLLGAWHPLPAVNLWPFPAAPRQPREKLALTISNTLLCNLNKFEKCHF